MPAFELGAAALPADYDDDHGGALLGALPLMLEHGTGSELRQPLGYTMVGGLILSQALTLFTTPLIYLYLDQFIGRRRHALAHTAAAAGERSVPQGAS